MRLPVARGGEGESFGSDCSGVSAARLSSLSVFLFGHDHYPLCSDRFRTVKSVSDMHEKCFRMSLLDGVRGDRKLEQRGRMSCGVGEGCGESYDNRRSSFAAGENSGEESG